MLVVFLNFFLLLGFFGIGNYLPIFCNTCWRLIKIIAGISNRIIKCKDKRDRGKYCHWVGWDWLHFISYRNNYYDDGHQDYCQLNARLSPNWTKLQHDTKIDRIIWLGRVLFLDLDSGSFCGWIRIIKEKLDRVGGIHTYYE